MRMEAWGPVPVLMDIGAQAPPPGTPVLQAKLVQVEEACVVVLLARMHG